MELYISIVSIVVATISFVFSMYVFKKNKYFSNAVLETEVLSRVLESKAVIPAIKQDIAAFTDIDKSDPLNKEILNAYNSAIDNFLTACNNACEKYYRFKFPEDSFRSLSENYFVKDINEIPESFDLNGYKYLNRYVLEDKTLFRAE